MKYLQPMTCYEFAQHLCRLETGDTIEFACYAGVDWPDEELDQYKAEDWYFARVMEISAYNSRFILIDYCGGEEAFAIPLNCYQSHCDADDTKIIPGYVREFFQKCDNISGVDAHVFVVMEE